MFGFPFVFLVELFIHARAGYGEKDDDDHDCVKGVFRHAYICSLIRRTRKKTEKTVGMEKRIVSKSMLFFLSVREASAAHFVGAGVCTCRGVVFFEVVIQVGHFEEVAFAVPEIADLVGLHHSAERDWLDVQCARGFGEWEDFDHALRPKSGGDFRHNGCKFAHAFTSS
jgi:hypothetical protein